MLLLSGMTKVVDTLSETVALQASEAMEAVYVSWETVYSEANPKIQAVEGNVRHELPAQSAKYKAW
jgi:hypothetical protein